MPTTTTHKRNQADIGRIVQRLTTAYAGRHSAAQVAAVVANAAGELGASKVRQYVPILVERMARETLDQTEL